MSLCRNCKHFHLHVTYYPHQFGIGRDVRPSLSTCKRTDMVTGSGDSGKLCSWERDKGECGPGAMNFEQAPPPRAPDVAKKPMLSWLRRIFG